MDSSAGQSTAQKKSPFDLIMNQIRRKRSFTDRKYMDRKPSIGRFFRPSESERGIPEDKESLTQDEKENSDPGTVGWGRVTQFIQKLGKIADESKLNLSSCDLTATDILELASLLVFLTLLEEVDLSWNDLIGGSLKGLTFHLCHVGRLRTLKLAGCRLTLEDVTALGEVLDSLPLLEVLDLSWNGGVGGGHLNHLTGQLCPNSVLKELHLVDCQLNIDDAQALARALDSLPRLEVLDLSCNDLMEEGLCELLPALSKSAALTTLNLHSCALQPHTLGLLGEVLSHLSALQILDLSCNKGTSGSFWKIAAQLAHLKHLHTLDLNLCCLTDQDIQALSQVLPSLSELRELDASSNPGVGAGLISTLPQSHMRRLQLSSCNLTDISIANIGPLSVVCLDVSWNKAVGGRLSSLQLESSRALQELRLSSCTLTTEDLLYLARVCRQGALCGLRLLDLSFNGGVLGEGWAALLGEAKHLRVLEELDFSLRPFTLAPAAPWFPALISALPQLPALTRFSLQHWSLTPQEQSALNHTPNPALSRSSLLEWDAPSHTLQANEPPS